MMTQEQSKNQKIQTLNVKNHVDIQYWFPNNGNPTCSNSVFHSHADLVDAMILSKETTNLIIK
jgi:hypothetical protein